MLKNPRASAGDKGDRFDPWVGKILWRRKWQPTPIFLSGEPHGQRSLVGYSLQGCKEMDTTEVAKQHVHCSSPHAVSGDCLLVLFILQLIPLGNILCTDSLIKVYSQHLHTSWFIMKRKRFSINPCQSSWKRWTSSGWIWDSSVKLFFTWCSSNINDPQFLMD